jgi:hypothetical protein
MWLATFNDEIEFAARPKAQLLSFTGLSDYRSSRAAPSSTRAHMPTAIAVTTGADTNDRDLRPQY